MSQESLQTKSLEATCELARVQYQTLVELERQQEDLRCQMSDLTKLANTQAIQESNGELFKVGEVVQDDQGVRYRLTRSWAQANFPTYTRGKTCGEKVDEFSPDRFRRRTYEGILLRKNGTPAWKNGRTLFGKLHKADNA